MRHQWKRYVCTVSLVLLTLAVFTLSASAIPNDPPLHQTVYVGCEDSPASLTHTTIQGAVNASDDGDTIKVCEGNYKENVVVPARLDGLRIVAQEEVKLKCPGTGPLASRGSGFDLHASYIEITGFDISGCASAISVEFDSDGFNLFSKNALHHNVAGVSFNSAGGSNWVVGNKIFDNSGNGIFDFGIDQDDSFVANEVWNNGGNGIEISNASNPGSIVSNQITHNGNGIYLRTVQNVRVRWNNLSKNTGDGLYLNASSLTRIEGNDADQNGASGIELSSTSFSNHLTDNRMQKNTGPDAADHNGGNFWTNNKCATTGGIPSVCVP